MTACIVGWSHGKFGKLDGETSESLIVKAASDAIAHAGIEPKDIDVIYVGIICIGLIALLMDLALRRIARRLVAWQERIA